MGYYGCRFAKFAKAAKSMLGWNSSRIDDGVALPEHYGKIWVLLVAEEERGKGLAGRLLDKCVTISRNRGGESLVVTVKKDNAPAIRVYERAGFKNIGTCEESSGESHLMILKLNAN
jgi:ribosomal protein S18 acetylase RimI-like enzyme